MSILKFTRALPGTQRRADVTNAIGSLRQQLRDQTIPVLDDIAESFRKVQLKSNMGKQFETQFRRYVNYDSNPLWIVVESLEQLANNLEHAEKESKRLFSFQFSSYGLTFSRANLLRFVEVASFYVDYARLLFLTIVAEEAALLGKATPTSWSKAAKQKIEVGLPLFCKLYQPMSRSTKEFASIMSGISTAEIDEETFDLSVRTLGSSKTDPMGIFAVGAFNPLFSLGKYMAERQVAQYKLEKDQLEALQLRLQEYKDLREEQARDGSVSPVVQKLITQTEKRIEDNMYKIRQFEEANTYD